MDRMSCASIIAVALVLLVSALSLTAAEFSPALDYRLKRAASDDYIEAIITLESPIDIRALDRQLHEERAPLAERHREVIAALKYNAADTQPAFQTELDNAATRDDVKGYTAYWIDNLFVVQARARFIEALRGRGDVKLVTENFRAELIEPIGDWRSSGEEGERPPRHTLDELTTPGQDAIGATRVNRELGITGNGVLVANLDTGVDGNHPALASRWRGNNGAPASECWLDVIGNSSTPNDPGQHGTHVMGTITGREISGGDTTTVGAAPNAQWIACNAIDQGASPNFNNDVIAAYQWFIDPDDDPSTMEDVPDVVQNSWGVNGNFPGYTTCFDLWNEFILNLEAAGTVVTWSAGNEGTSGLRAPAIFEFNPTQIFSVGAVSVHAGDAPPYSIAGFSSRGPSPCLEGGIKPEVAAPGVDVYSSVPGGGYASNGWSGTSMSGPHVAGMVALMREACPDCDPTTIKEAILNTAIDDGYGPVGDDNTFGMGFIDAYEAVMAVNSLGGIAGVVTDQSAQALAGVLVNVVETGRSMLTSSDGVYELALSSGTYTVEFSKFGYATVTLFDVMIVEEQTVTQDITLQSVPSEVLTGRVLAPGLIPAPGATVSILEYPIDPVTTNGAGEYELTLPIQNNYTVMATSSEHGAVRESVTFGGAMVVDLILPDVIFCDDFEADRGWTTPAPGDNAASGQWNRMDPIGTFIDGNPVQPEDDHTNDPGNRCWVTDGDGGGASAHDVDGGLTTLLSPVWDLSDYEQAVIQFWSWYSNDEGNNPGEDELQIDVSNDGGVNWVPLFNTLESWEFWKQDILFLSDAIELTDQVQVRIIALDESSPSLVEAAIDDFCLYAGPTLIEAPTEVTIIRMNDTVVLRWPPVLNAQSYWIWWSDELPISFATATIIGQVSDTSFVDTDMLPYDTGYYVVTAHR